MDYEKIIHALIDPIVENKDIIMIRELPSDSSREVVLLIVAESDDTARLIGRKGDCQRSSRTDFSRRQK